MDNNKQTPFLIPLEQSEFFSKIQELVRNELRSLKMEPPVAYETPGLVKKPLYRPAEVCAMLSISRQTLHQWAKEGLLKPYKVKSRVFYLTADIEAMLKNKKP